ncbi:hypothetical protein FLA_0042 [Filimonas lacunae]|nr:hypothetical protein FLA_0042 [Filimonas lacunae]
MALLLFVCIVSLLDVLLQSYHAGAGGCFRQTFKKLWLEVQVGIKPAATR